MKRVFGSLVLIMAIAAMPARGQMQGQGRGPGQGQGQAQGRGPDTTGLKTTYVSLGNANAILVEPITPDPVRSHIALLITHPEHANNFNYFIGWDLAHYGYRAMMLNYYGKEDSYYEFIQPLAAAIKALRAIPGVDKVVLAGHSSGGAELTSYEDVAENGSAACTGAERVYKCNPRGLDNLPRSC